MIISNRKSFIKNLKLDTNINKFIFAKTLFAFSKNPSDDFLILVANTLMNKFIVEEEMMDEIPSIVKLLTSFDCWKDLSFMENIDTNNPIFRKCLAVSSKVLSGNLDEKFSGTLCFHKKSESHLLTKNVTPKFVVDGFSFFDVYM